MSNSSIEMTQAFITTIPAPLTASRSSFTCNSMRRTHRSNTVKSRRAVIVAAAVPLEVDEDTFEKEVIASSNEQPVLVDFYAPWCGPCKLVSPLMDWAAIEYDGEMKVVKIDTDTSKSFVKRYEIHGLPTFAVFKEGEAFGVKEGAMGKKELDEYISKHTGIKSSD